MKKFVSFLLVLVLSVSVMSFVAGATDINEKIEFTYKSGEVESGNVTLDVYMNVKTDVARLWGFDFVISFSKGLMLESVAFSDVLPGAMHEKIDSANEVNEVALLLDNNGIPMDKTFNNGEYPVATLVFKAEEGLDEKDIYFSFVTEYCTVVRVGDYENELVYEFVSDTPSVQVKPGDLNNDDKINGRDYAILLQYINDWDVEVNEAAADVNGDGKINGRDYGMVLQYVNGWDVTFGK